MIVWIIFCVLATASIKTKDSAERQMWNDIVYNNDVLAWSRHITGQDVNDPTIHDRFESIAFIPGDVNSAYEDVGYIVVQRTIDDVNERYIEMFQPLDFGDQNDAWFVDCADDGRRIYHGEVEGELGWTDYTSYFVGIDRYSEQEIVYKCNSDNTLDTDWGTDGYFSYDSFDNFGSSGYNAGYSLLQLDDDRLLVVHDVVWIDAAHLWEGGKQAVCTMLDEDGEVDTTWGYEGHYISAETGDSYPCGIFSALLQDDDGNFHLFSQSGYIYHKFDPNGTRLFAKAGGGAFLEYFSHACWADEDKTRIIAVGMPGNHPTGYINNTMALDPTDGSVDTTWGNLGWASCAGYAHIDNEYAEESANAYAVVMYDSNLYVIHSYGSDPDKKTFSKVIADGSAYDTTWGTDGHVCAGKNRNWGDGGIFVDANGIFYTLCDYSVPGEADDNTDMLLRSWDSDGDLIASHTFEGDSTNIYNNMMLFNDMIIMGTKKYDPATYYIERWTTDFEFIDGFDITGMVGSDRVMDIILDETTKVYETIGAADAYWETLDVNHAHLEAEYVCIFEDGEPLSGTYLVEAGEITEYESETGEETTSPAYLLKYDGGYLLFINGGKIELAGSESTGVAVTLNNYIAGLNYYSVYESFPIVAHELAKNQRTSIHRVALDLYETYGLNIGTDMEHSSEISFDEMTTGYKIVEFPRGEQIEPVVYLWIYDPVPCTVRGIYLNEEIMIRE